MIKTATYTSKDTWGSKRKEQDAKDKFDNLLCSKNTSSARDACVLPSNRLCKLRAQLRQTFRDTLKDIATVEEIECIERQMRMKHIRKYIMHAVAAAIATIKDRPIAKYKHCEEITDLICSLNLPADNIILLADKLINGGLLNIDAFNKLLCPIKDLFINDDAYMLFNALVNHNVGTRQTGKGEWALAIMSGGNIVMADKGDLLSKTLGMIELKYAANVSGGRLMSGGHNSDIDLAIFEKYEDVYGIPASELKSSISLGKFIEQLNLKTPPTTEANRAARRQFIKDLLEPRFGKYSNQAIITISNVTDHQRALIGYICSNFNCYKSENKFDVLTTISAANGYMCNIRTVDDIISLYSSGILLNPSVSMLPTSAGSREIAVQISLTKNVDKLKAAAELYSINDPIDNP